MFKFIKEWILGDIEKRVHYLENMERAHDARISALTLENTKLKERVANLEKENKANTDLLLDMNDDMLQMEAFCLDAAMVTKPTSILAVEEAEPLKGGTIRARNIHTIAQEQRDSKAM